MAAFFIDLDGTFFVFGTNSPLPGAVETVSALLRQGHQVIFTTQRGERTSAELALKQLLKISVPVIADVASPRIVINDFGAVAINHPTNAPWSAEMIKDLLGQPTD